MGTSSGNVFLKKPRRNPTIRAPAQVADSLNPGGRHGPAEIDRFARSRAQGAVAARRIQELRPEGQRHRPRGGRDHRRRVRQDRRFAGEADPHAFRRVAAPGRTGLSRLEDRDRGEGGSLRLVPGRAGELHHRRFGALPVHREVSRLHDESEAVRAARPVERRAAAHRDPRPAEGALRPGNYSTFTPIARTSFPHFSTSAARKARASAGEALASASMPMLASCSFSCGFCAIFTSAAWSRLTRSSGVPAVARIAYQVDTSNPGNPLSARVGVPGANAECFAPVSARSLSFPALANGATFATGAKLMCTCPDTKSVIAGAAPL